ncbi:MAG: hypothetical protein IJ404_05500 [Clostridia bacterium]|nr:hypothetical protein [Clostridia bacterium]
MRTRLLSVISLLLATVLVLGALFTSCSPKKKASKVTQYLDKIIEATFENLSTKNSQVTTSKLTINNTADLGIPHFVGSQTTIITGKNGERVSNTEITLDSGKLDLSLYTSDSTVIIGSSAIGSSKYGFEAENADTIIGLFGSMFIPSAPDSSANGILGSMNGIGTLLEGNNPERVYTILEKYMEIVSDAAQSACKSNIKSGDEITVVVEFNTSSTKKLIKDVFASLKQDDELKTLLETTLISSGMTEEQAKEQMDAILSDETVKALYDELDKTPFTFTVTFKANKDYILNGLFVEYKSGADKVCFFLDATESGKTELGCSAAVEVEGVAHTSEQKLVFENKVVDGAAVFEISYVSVFDESSASNTLLKTEIKDGKYSAVFRVEDERLDVGYYNVTVAGDVALAGNKTTYTVTSATALGKTIALDVKIETEIGGTVPEFPTDFKNILNVTGDEFKIIMNNLKNSPLGQFIPKNEPGIALPDVE